MKSHEELVAPDSDYFIYSPSKQALDMFLYPMQCGSFSYLPGYSLTRDSFDSFLLMYVQKGELSLTFEGNTRLGNVFSMPDTTPVLAKLTAILKIFSGGSPVREPLLSKYLTDILTEFLLYTPTSIHTRSYTNITEEIITYINEHFRENISLEDLASHAGLSQYHFIRIFKKETGFTPHEYIINTRLATAKYLLKNSRLSVKDICFTTGFSCESVFCSAFKRHQGMTPAQYRALEQP